MARTQRRLTLTCTDCGHPFLLTARAYAQRRARYPDGRLLCQRCIGACCLRGHGRAVAARLFQEAPPDPPDPDAGAVLIGEEAPRRGPRAGSIPS